MQDIILRKQQTLHTAWATPALRPSGRGGIFSGLVENMTLICRTRWSNRPLVEEGQRRTKPPMSEPPTTSRNKQKNGIRCRTNKRRERRGETKTIFFFPPKIFAKREKKGWGRLTACIAGHAIQRKNPQDESQRFSKWRLPTLPQRSAVPSAMLSLTTLFGMGRGGTSAL